MQHSFCLLDIVFIFRLNPKLMSSVKNLILSIILLSSFRAFSQNQDAVFMKWKLKPGEKITYKTTMDEIDTGNHKDFSMDGMAKLMGDSTNSGEFKKILKQLNKEAQNENMVTSLEEKRKGVVDIEMSVSEKEHNVNKDTSKADSGFQKFQALMNKMTNGVMLRGAIYENGGIESFYTKSEQKNLIALFFELPGKAVKVADSWALDLHFISMDQSFICDTSYQKNNVTVTGIDKKDNETIVTLKYDIVEYVDGDFKSPFDGSVVKTSMKMTYQAIAGFSVERGRWIAYDGIMSLSSTGIMSSQTTKKFSLIAE